MPTAIFSVQNIANHSRAGPSRPRNRARLFILQAVLSVPTASRTIRSRGIPCAGRPTPRCSGLVSLAAELDIVRPRPLHRQVWASSFHPPPQPRQRPPSKTRLSVLSERLSLYRAQESVQSSAHCTREAGRFLKMPQGVTPLSRAPAFTPRSGPFSVRSQRLVAIIAGSLSRAPSNPSPRACPASCSRTGPHHGARPNPSLQRTRFTRR